MEWPPRSPDLTLPDFFLWGLIKAHVYRSRVPSIVALKSRIRAAIDGVPSATLKAALDVLPLRARACIRQRGGYPETSVIQAAAQLSVFDFFLDKSYLCHRDDIEESNNGRTIHCSDGTACILH